jgi:hypothetical protein
MKLGTYRLSRHATVLLAIGAALVLLVALYIRMLEHGEMGEKPFGPILQHAELKHRNDSDQHSVLLETDILGSGYSALGMPSADAPERVWVIVNGTSPGGKVMIMTPRDKFRLECTYLAQLRSTVKIHPKVLSFLRERCTP